MAAVNAPESDNGHSRIALHFPEGRELLWVTADSPLFGWEVGQEVVYRSSEWIVLGRTESEDDDSLTFRLGAA